MGRSRVWCNGVSWVLSQRTTREDGEPATVRTTIPKNRTAPPFTLSPSEWVSDAHRLTSSFRHVSNVRLTGGPLQAERDAPLTPGLSGIASGFKWVRLCWSDAPPPPRFDRVIAGLCLGGGLYRGLLCCGLPSVCSKACREAVSSLVTSSLSRRALSNQGW